MKYWLALWFVCTPFGHRPLVYAPDEAYPYCTRCDRCFYAGDADHEDYITMNTTKGTDMATRTMTVRRDRSGVPSTIDEAAHCPGCGCEPEVARYFIRRMRRADTGEQVAVRVGYHCTCSVIVVDGLVQGGSAMTD